MTKSPQFHLAVALDGAGWHPAAWRDHPTGAAELLDARYWVGLVAEAERGLLDFVTFDDSLAIQSTARGVVDDRVDQIRGRLDAVLVAARVAPTTSGIGLIPVATTTHIEPFHVSKAIATLDYVSNGRAGVQVRVSSSRLEAEQFGRRLVPDVATASAEDPVVVQFRADLFDEAADFVEVLRRLWDSWEDDAENPEDVATGRFVDRDRLHYIDFEGRWFSVRGPAITPRPPQGQPVVAALAHAAIPFRLAARSADLVFVTPHDLGHTSSIVSEIRQAEVNADRAAPPLLIFADLVVFLDDEREVAAVRKSRLDQLDGRVFHPDAFVFAGTPEELVDLLESWSLADIAGFRLRPGTLPHDLEAISHRVVPLLQSRGLFREHYEPGTLRERLGLALPPNRYTGSRELESLSVAEGVRL